MSIIHMWVTFSRDQWVNGHIEIWTIRDFFTVSLHSINSRQFDFTVTVLMVEILTSHWRPQSIATEAIPTYI